MMAVGEHIESLGIVAGKGIYPRLMIAAVRRALPSARIILVTFQGETHPELTQLVDEAGVFRVGQVSKPCIFLRNRGVKHVIMAGQITPQRLYQLRPDLRLLWGLRKLKERNAETLFTLVINMMKHFGLEVLPATSFMEDCMPMAGHLAGPKPSRQQMADARYGLSVAKEISKLNIGQGIIVRRGTILAVEAFEGTNKCIRRGGLLGEGKDVSLVKVSKPNHDMRFDVPIIGPDTVKNCASVSISQIVIEAGKTIIVEQSEVLEMCKSNKITLQAI